MDRCYCGIGYNCPEPKPDKCTMLSTQEKLRRIGKTLDETTRIFDSMNPLKKWRKEYGKP